MGYGQSYYTLRSVFFSGVAPPAIHLHIRSFDVQSQVPIGNLTSTNLSILPDTSSGAVELEIPDKEKAEFDAWLRNLWCVQP
jgi:hypothetical protein